jgi:uncharacterized membrane protein
MPSNSDAMERLKSASQSLAKTLGDKAVGTAGDRLGGLTDRLQGIAEGGPIKQAVAQGGEAAAKGNSPVAGALKGAVSGVKDMVTGGGGGDGGSPKATKATNIEEQIDVGVPVRLAYNQWTEFGAFPSFMKKVENVDATDDNQLEWKAQIFWSHRHWTATILEQVPDERIVWRSKGEKGHVDGAVTFHEVAPNLTRILVVLEYYPQGLMERTGNLWRAQGRRARAELRHFRRHVMTRAILDPDEVEGWRGTIEDGEVVQDHEEALEEQQRADGSEDEYDESEGEESEGEESEGEESETDDGEDEYDEDEYDEDEEEPEDEEDLEPDDEGEVAEDEEDLEAEDADEEVDEEADEEAEDEEDGGDEYDEYEDEDEPEEAEDSEEELEAEDEEAAEDSDEFDDQDGEEPEVEESDEEPADEPTERHSRARRRRAS